jgi:hypothetical protein
MSLPPTKAGHQLPTVQFANIITPTTSWIRGHPFNIQLGHSRKEGTTNTQQQIAETTLIITKTHF